MGNFKYTYNIEEFDKFYQSRLAPELQALAKKRMLPWKSKATAQEAFNITCSLLGRFSPYEGKSSENTYNFLKDLRLFPDFLHVKYNGCFSGHSAGKAFDAKSMELYKNDGKKDVLVWRGVLVSTQYHNRTFGRVLFRKRGLNVDNPDTIKLIFNKNNTKSSLVNSMKTFYYFSSLISTNSKRYFCLIKGYFSWSTSLKKSSNFLIQSSLSPYKAL